MAAIFSMIAGLIGSLTSVATAIPGLISALGAVWANGRSVLLSVAIAAPLTVGGYYAGKWRGHSEAERRHAAIVAQIRADDARATLDRERQFEAEIAQYRTIEADNDRTVAALPAVKATPNDASCARAVMPRKWVRSVRKLR